MKKNPLRKESGLVEARLLNRKSLPWLLALLLGFLMLTQSCKKVDQTPAKNNTSSVQNSIVSKSYDLKLVAGGFVSPLGVVDPMDGTKRLFVIDQIGKVWIIFPNGIKSSQPFINIASKLVNNINPFYDERGLLGLAFHPNFKSNGKFYLYYTAPPRAGGPAPGIPWDNTCTVSEFKVSAGDPNKADLSSERRIIRIDHPQSNHNGGTIAFGPDDGYLYISIGDGGAGSDTGVGHVNDWYAKNRGGNGQDIYQNLLGNILRIDVNTVSDKRNYGIPADNPFNSHQGLNEIWAFGFRNPYRFSFDMVGQHRLFVGDAGQSLYEEIDVAQKGGNYGWNVKEGTHCFNADNEFKERFACPVEDSAGNPLIDPIIEVKNYHNPEGGGETITVVGGNVYRGQDLPELYGKYVFGFLSADDEKAEGKIVVARPSSIGLWPYEVLKLKSFPDNLGQWVKGFGQNARGDIYVTASIQLGPQGFTGKVWKLVAAE
jgi:glucose/arabinose dehydrogenase